MTNVTDKLVGELKRHEGFSEKMYKCSAGYNTIGYGMNIDVGLPEDEAALLLRYRLEKLDRLLIKAFDWYSNLTQARKEVIVNMVYNLGLDGFKGFKNTIYLIKNSRHEEASKEMLKSKWAEQVGNRAKYLSEKYKQG